MIPKRKDSYVLRNVHGTYFLIDITCSYADDKCHLYELNQIGAFIWEHMDGNKDIRQISEELLAALADDIALEVIITDVANYADTLQKCGFIEVL